MLIAWQNGLALEVLDEFNEYGFRRACDLAHRSLGWIEDEQLWPYYRTCERAMSQMGVRKQLTDRDEERGIFAPKPERLSMEDTNDEDLDEEDYE